MTAPVLARSSLARYSEPPGTARPTRDTYCPPPVGALSVVNTVLKSVSVIDTAFSIGLALAPAPSDTDPAPAATE